LREHEEALHRISRILVERETIDRDQFLRLLDGEDEEAVFASSTTGPPEPERRRRSEPKPARTGRLPLPQSLAPKPPEPDAPPSGA
jgi:cell division protease FtsH